MGLVILGITYVVLGAALLAYQIVDKTSLWDKVFGIAHVVLGSALILYVMF